MRRRNLIWIFVLVVLNLLVLLRIVQIWWPEKSPTGPAAKVPAPPLAPLPLPEIQPLQSYQVIVQKNLFSSLRLETGKPAAAAKAGGPEKKLTLLGTVIIGSQRAALVGIDPAGGKKGTPQVEVLRLGDSWQDYLVREITPAAVVLEQEGKTITLSFPETETQPGKGEP